MFVTSATRTVTRVTREARADAGTGINDQTLAGGPCIPRDRHIFWPWGTDKAFSIRVLITKAPADALGDAFAGKGIALQTEDRGRSRPPSETDRYPSNYIISKKKSTALELNLGLALQRPGPPCAGFPVFGGDVAAEGAWAYDTTCALSNALPPVESCTPVHD